MRFKKLISNSGTLSYVLFKAAPCRIPFPLLSHSLFRLPSRLPSGGFNEQFMVQLAPLPHFFLRDSFQSLPRCIFLFLSMYLSLMIILFSKTASYIYFTFLYISFLRETIRVIWYDIVCNSFITRYIPLSQIIMTVICLSLIQAQIKFLFLAHFISWNHVRINFLCNFMNSITINFDTLPYIHVILYIMLSPILIIIYRVQR